MDSAAVLAATLLANSITFTLGTDVSLAVQAVSSAFVIAASLFALAACRSRDLSMLDVAAEENRRVAKAVGTAFASGAAILLAAAAVGFCPQVCTVIESDTTRLFVPIVFTGTLLTLLTGRYLMRRDLANRRANGEGMTRIVVLGNEDSATRFCDSLCRHAAIGYDVVGVCIPDFTGDLDATVPTALGALPVLSDHASIALALQVTGADAVVVTSAEELGPDRMKTLEWTLQDLDVELLVVPGLADTVRERITLGHIDNAPIMHVKRPRFEGPAAVVKRAFDLAFGTLALLVALPVMAVVAVAIKLDDGGPVMFRQTRVGLHGKPFRIFKFRTMIVDAEARKDDERKGADQAGVFFKSANDSRITRVGRVLRKTSLDELPQLFNVLGGSMSIVGPRPLVPGEGSSVPYFLQRRALLKPGMTGLWQISGRSDVSDEERIRLDHAYVDNFSTARDLMIVAGTATAVLQRKGAY
ncbi:hypothetical protein MPHL43072_05785 [Mycolicibacterium phlei DSM 43072]|uniref:Polyprenyl glycosylphosphotransferase n=1 Tax=Mycolicibacterium phlei DSM 43239 = CCUG 21000 TaxID=1226750 RepID=A0A5N5UQ43_MYCPH|nr:polyprenyl glycosylphosphotransferase [Mycolicibacterium phlei DSM 43239 = CCUG 21000]KXW60299.1 polyprenyl glycosylphosphotransferase [Mycolicibacterium phlei DSM 43239 = CCUG 21000]KXW65944.1 hypothetical protein MPHL43070_21410 [Mycolicibacterium phlei DSM 43070]KXW66625.1 hypothetical protein MPHL43072_05785 [Mycolicibacterium phlei DSM 43072]